MCGKRECGSARHKLHARDAAFQWGNDSTAFLQPCVADSVCLTQDALEVLCRTELQDLGILVRGNLDEVAERVDP